MLEKEGYILAYSKVSCEDGQARFGQGIGNSEHYVTYDFPDKRVKDLLLEYTSKDILITPEFERFCKKVFLARDEQRFRRQIKLAYLAFTVTLIAALANSFFNLFNTFCR